MSANKILVTGVAGFVGSNLALKLLERGSEVIGVDIVNDYYNVLQKEKNLAELSKYKNFKFYKIDFCNSSLVNEIFANHKLDAVAHLGAMANVRYSVERPDIYVLNNILGTSNLLQAAVKNNVNNFILASTSSVYGERSEVPFFETDRTDTPLSPYPASKKSAEVLAHAFHNSHGINISVLRFFNVYGPKGRPDMMPFRIIKNLLNGSEITIYGEGELKRDWTFIEDNLQGVIAALDKPHPYEIFNLGRGEPLSVNDVVYFAEKITGKAANKVFVKTPATEVSITYASIDKAKRMLGYSPSTHLEQGLEKFWTWCQSNMELLN